MIRFLLPSLTTICTAVAPEAVFTFRRNGLTYQILPPD